MFMQRRFKKERSMKQAMTFVEAGLSSLSIRSRLFAGYSGFAAVAIAMTGCAVLQAPSDMQGIVASAGLSGIFGSMLIAYFVNRSISRPLVRAIAAVQRLKSGEIAFPTNVTDKGEFGILQNALTETSEGLFGVILKIRSGIISVATTSGYINLDNQALSSRTAAQAGVLEETAAAIEELTATVQQNADHTQLAMDIASEAANCATEGNDAMDLVSSTMDSIAAGSNKMKEIIGVIDGIAFQTNILALNAAVEAARVGEQGRGFAVVATEVRNLAQRSSAAASEIKALITDSVDKVDAGANHVGNAGRKMREIVESVTSVSNMIKEISRASLEQRSAIQLVQQSVIQIDDTTQKNAQLVENAAKASSSLRQQALSLSDTVAMYQLGEREFGNADEAMALVEKAIEFSQLRGKQKLLDEISNIGSGSLGDRDLYLIVAEMANGKIVAHGTDLSWIGSDVRLKKDINGKDIGGEMFDIAQRNSSGWIDYKFQHPVSKEILTKCTYFKIFGGMLFMCGFSK
jgi:methyl-accepting chemotaxis protein